MPFKVEISEAVPGKVMTAAVTVDEPGYMKDVQVVSSDKRVHVLFYKKEGDAGDRNDEWRLTTIASDSGTERYMTVMVIVGNELKANARKLIKDGAR